MLFWNRRVWLLQTGFLSFHPHSTAPHVAQQKICYQKNCQKTGYAIVLVLNSRKDVPQVVQWNESIVAHPCTEVHSVLYRVFLTEVAFILLK